MEGHPKAKIFLALIWVHPYGVLTTDSRMARSQKPITIKLNQDQITVLDKVVELGEFNGRSHAMRELLLPALNAGVTAMNQGSLRAMVTWVKEIDGLNQRMKTIEKNSLKGKQEDMDMDLGLPPIEVQPV